MNVHYKFSNTHLAAIYIYIDTNIEEKDVET